MDQVKNNVEKKFEKYIDNYSIWNRIARLSWCICWLLLVRPFSLPFFKGWRRMIYIIFGAKIGKGSIIHSSVKVWAPWNLEIGQKTAIGHDAIIYNPGKIILGNKVAVSQYSYLCTATHDYTSRRHTLYWKEIIVDDYVWIAARSFIAPGVHVGEGAVVGATASVYKNVEPWTVVGGNPAKFIKKREIKTKNLL